MAVIVMKQIKYVADIQGLQHTYTIHMEYSLRLPIESLEFFVKFNLPAALWPWGRLSL